MKKWKSILKVNVLDNTKKIKKEEKYWQSLI